MSHDEQQGLIRYLTTAADPYDFQFAIAEWARETDEVDLAHDDAQVDDLNERQLKSFEKWLATQRGRWIDELGAEAPSYLFFSGVHALPRGSWIVHLTDASPFTSFKYGALLWELGLTRHLSEVARKKNVAECEVAADQRQPLYGFGFRAEDRTWRWGGATRKYGRNAVFFRHDTAVVAHHEGDGEDQVIFDICGVYDAVPVWGISPIDGGGTVATDNGDVELDDWQAVIKWATQRRQQARKTKRTRKALGALQAPSRWVPGLRQPGAFFSLFRGRR